MEDSRYRLRGVSKFDAPALVTPALLGEAVHSIKLFVQGHEWPLRLQNVEERVKKTAS
jgi:hypothetical protein